MGRTEEYSMQGNVAEGILSLTILGILDSHFLRPKVNSAEVPKAIASGNLRCTTSTTRLATGEESGSSGESRVSKIRGDKKIASIQIQIQNLRDEIRREELAEVRNQKKIDRLRDKRKVLNGKVHRIFTAL